METLISEEKYSCYEFDICSYPDDGYPSKKYYFYKIYGHGCPPYDDGIIETDEQFETAQEARFAAIGHITKLEEGADYD